MSFGSTYHTMRLRCHNEKKKKMTLLLLESGQGNCRGPKLSRQKHTNWKKDRRIWGISRKSSWRQWVRNVSLTEKKRRDRPEQEVRGSQTAGFLNQLWTEDKVESYSLEKKPAVWTARGEDETNDFFREQNIDRETCKNCTGRWTGTREERETEGET